MKYVQFICKILFMFLMRTLEWDRKEWGKKNSSSHSAPYRMCWFFLLP